ELARVSYRRLYFAQVFHVARDQHHPDEIALRVVDRVRHHQALAALAERRRQRPARLPADKGLLRQPPQRVVGRSHRRERRAQRRQGRRQRRAQRLIEILPDQQRRYADAGRADLGVAQQQRAAELEILSLARIDGEQLRQRRLSQQLPEVADRRQRLPFERSV